MSPVVQKNTTIGTAAASTGIVAGLVVIIVWVLSLAHVVVPAEVGAAITAVLSPIAHLIAVKYGLDPSNGSSGTDSAVLSQPITGRAVGA